ncbi:polycomb group protein Pc [Drosophila eugracilis]|uniref:polycomb group protein Pc n=1 Tax=Drosophila eugracilis TaxID=29029 RepID=UPI0007E5D568|nr:polycomb group protein Pc [Drosophila eugracilis]
MTTRRDDMAWISSQYHMQQHLLVLLICVIPLVAGFGNEYVHIKVHVPKEESAAEETPHKVIHHYHHHPHPHQLQRNRGRARPKPSPLLESVILSDLDKPLHMSEHADYLNHAKELADHLTETYAKKPPPPPPPKKKVNTYTIIEEQHRPHAYDYEDHHDHGVETYRVIESRPKPQHHHHHHHPEEEEEEEDVGYHYPSGGKHSHNHNHHSFGIGAYAEPAPVEEHVEQESDTGYNYSPPSHSYIPPSHSHAYRNSKSNRAPAYTLEAPQESSYGYDYSRPSSGSSSDFRPSVQVPSSDPYGEEEPADTYGPPPPLTTRRRRPSQSVVDWPESKGFNSAAAETYSGVDSYNVGHVQGYGSSSYQYSGPYL